MGPTLPNCRICCTRPFTWSTGMAKPTPEDDPLPVTFAPPGLLIISRYRLRESALNALQQGIVSSAFSIAILALNGRYSHLPLRSSAAQHVRLDG